MAPFSRCLMRLHNVRGNAYVQLCELLAGFFGEFYIIRQEVITRCDGFKTKGYKECLIFIKLLGFIVAFRARIHCASNGHRINILFRIIKFK